MGSSLPKLKISKSKKSKVSKKKPVKKIKRIIPIRDEVIAPKALPASPNINEIKENVTEPDEMPQIEGADEVEETEEIEEAPSELPQIPMTKKTLAALRRDIISERDVAMDFAGKVHKKFGSLVKATILFGSQAKNSASPGSDIDVIIIIDDAAVNWDDELVVWYRDELGKILSGENYASKLHISTVKLTTWWQDLMHGDAVVINIIRSGEPLIDIGGFFNPLKALLLQGRIHSTPEAVYVALQRSPYHLARSKASILTAVEGVYWTMVDAAQAALITLGKLPPSPEHITGMLKESFVDTKMLKIDYVKWYRDVYALHKIIAHGNLKEIRGQEIDELQKKAELFLNKMTEIIDRLIDAQRNQVK